MAEEGDPAPRILVLMGVAGCGKTTVGEMLAECLGWRFLEGDALHPPENVEKMRAGIPLGDDDRWPWLAAVAGRIDIWRGQEASGIVACSALKRAYRDVLIGPREDVGLVHLHGSRALIGARLAARTGHFMPPALLDSQLRTLEPPGPEEKAMTIAIDGDPAAIVARILERLA